MTRRSTAAPAPAPTIPKIPPTQVLGRLAALQTAPTAALKKQWRGLFGQEPPPRDPGPPPSPPGDRIPEPAHCRRWVSSWMAATWCCAASAPTADRWLARA